MAVGLGDLERQPGGGRGQVADQRLPDDDVLVARLAADDQGQHLLHQRHEAGPGGHGGPGRFGQRIDRRERTVGGHQHDTAAVDRRLDDRRIAIGKAERHAGVDVGSRLQAEVAIDRRRQQTRRLAVLETP